MGGKNPALSTFLPGKKNHFESIKLSYTETKMRGAIHSIYDIRQVLKKSQNK